MGAGTKQRCIKNKRPLSVCLLGASLARSRPFCSQKSMPAFKGLLAPQLFFCITFLSRERFVRFVPCHIVSRHGFCAAVRLSQFYAQAVHTVSLCFRFCCATFARNEVEHDGVCYAFICRTRSPLCNLADRGIVSAVNISVVVVPEGWRSHLGPANQLEFDFVSTIPSLLFFKPRERYLYTQ